MNMAMIFRTAWRSLTINKMRSALTALGIIIGVASVIMMVSLSQGATAGITESIASMGTNILTIMPSGGFGVNRGAGGGSLKMEDIQAIAQLPYVKNIAPIAGANVTATVGSVSWNAELNGTSSAMQAIKNWEFTEGGFFTQEDENNMANVVVIGQTVVDNLFSSARTAVGSNIRINGLDFTVIGVIPVQGSGMSMGSDQDDIIYMPLRTAQLRLLGEDSIRNLTVQADSQDTLPFLKNAIGSLLRERHRLASDADDDFRIMDSAELLSTVEDTTRILSLLLGGIAAVSLIVGGIGVMNIMLVSVTERTREIGIRMAIGATTSHILNQFLIEAVLLCIIGGTIGSMIGIGFSWLFGVLSGWSMKVEPWSIIIAISFSMIVGMTFGYYPARKAAEADPIEALRFE